MPNNLVFLKQIKSRLDDFKTITKMGLSLSVVFSCIAGYLLAAKNVNSLILIMLAVGVIAWWVQAMFLIKLLKGI